MEPKDVLLEFIWLPSEGELAKYNDDFERKENKESASFKLDAPVIILKTFLNKLFNLSVDIYDFKHKTESGSNDQQNSENHNKALIYLSYSEYLFNIFCKIKLEKWSSVFDEYKKLIYIFCSRKANSPQLWLKIDTSVFVENDLRTSDYFINLNSFSLGNLVKLNTFVDHFNSESSLNPYSYKITQVKVKFLHDEQVFHLHFVVVNTKISKKKQGPHSHRMHKLVIPYSSLHTILISNEKSVAAAYFRLYVTPLLFAVEQDEDKENYVSYMDLQYNTKWWRTVSLFDSCPSNINKEFTMNSVLRLDFCKEIYEVMKIIHHHKSAQIYFTNMSVVQYTNVQPNFQLQDFDCYFGLQCLLTHSYETLDQLMIKEDMETFKSFIIEKCNQNPKALSKAFYVVHSALNQCNIVLLNYSLKCLYEAIVKNVSEFLDVNTLYDNHSNHNLLLVKRAVVIPTHVRFVPPQPILKNRALRCCDYNFSLRISIRDVNLATINFSFKGFSDKRKELLKHFFETYYKKVMLRGIKIGKRCYKYVGSSTSQLRGHGLWFYAQDNDGKTAEILREEFGNMDKIKQVPKYMARMGQTFSQAMGNIIVPQKYTNIDSPEEDVKIGIKKYLQDEDLDKPGKFLKLVGDNPGETAEPYIFSDGIGRISSEVAKEVYKKLDVEEKRPSAMQIRYAGCKGMLVVDPNLKGKKIIFRESMKKFSSSNDSLEILKFSEKRAASLNRPLITILEQLGVKKEIFVKLQKDMIQNHIKSMFHETEACDFLNRNSKLRFDFIHLHKMGIHFTEDPLFRSMIYALFRKQLELLRTKANIEIPVNKGRAMFGVLDETFTLEYGQVFVQYSDWNTDKPVIIQGPIVVTKNPCMHPGDVRKFQAVDVESLHHIRDCIVFPAKGPRPHPDEMAGSDLDGDEYHVMWLEEFLFDRENEEAMDYAMKKDHTMDLKRKIEPVDELDHVCDYIVNENVGLIASAHLVFADKEEKGIFSENCIRLAKKYAIALDFAKSGKIASRNKKDRPFMYPDFVEKVGEKNTYLSKKALGVLYRNCKKLEMGLETSNNKIQYRIDQDLIYKNWKKYEASAEKSYNKYCQKIEYLMNIYSFENEGELLAGSIINPPKYYNQRHDLDNLKVLLEYEMNWIFQDFERHFFSEFGGKPKDKCYTSDMLQKASAWYAVTYTEKTHQYYGFPWSISDVLAQLKMNQCKRQCSINRHFNSKSLLEQIVDRCVAKHMPELSEESDINVIHDNRFNILDIAFKVLKMWLRTQRDHLLLSDLKAFENCIAREFESVSGILLSCDIQYIENLKKNNNIKKATSPCYYVIETMLHIANVKTKNPNIAFTDSEQELGLLSWVTLIKLACTYNPQYLGIPNLEGNYAQSIFYMPQESIVSQFKLFLFEKNIANQDFSSKLLTDPDLVTKYLCQVTKLKKIEFRYDIDRNKDYYAKFTVMGSRYSIEKLKDFILLDDFYKWVVEDWNPYENGH